jgi:hypothetical protein
MADAETFVKVFFSIIEESLHNDRAVQVKGLGTFRIDAKLTFTPDNNLREVINRPFEHFDTVLLNDGVSFDDVEVVDETPAAATAPAEETPAEEKTVVEEAPAEEAPAEDAPAEEQPVEEAPAEQPAEQPVEEDPLQRMIAEAVEQKRKREAIVSDIYSKREETSTTPPPPVVERPRRKRNYMKYVVNGMLIVVFAAIFGCGFMVLKMYFPEMFASNATDNTAEADKMAMDFQQIVLSDTTIITTDDTLTAPEVQDTAYLYDSAAMVAIDAMENMESAAKMKDSKEIKPVAVKEIKAEPAKATSLSAHNEAQAKQAAAKPAATQQQPAAAAKPAAADKTAVNNTPVHPDSVTYKVKGTKATHTLQPGETLTRVSLKYYGTKDLYPYIVKYNSDVIKNPNNVPIGTTLKIPELVKK